MLRLNGAAARLLRTLAVQAATDITGFGLLGHAHEMAAAAGVRFEVVAADVPLLAGAYDYAAADFLPGGQERNRDYLTAPADGGARVTIGADVDPLRAELLFDPQTSGGLLFAAPATAAARGRVHVRRRRPARVAHRPRAARHQRPRHLTEPNSRDSRAALPASSLRRRPQSSVRGQTAASAAVTRRRQTPLAIARRWRRTG